MERKQFEGIIKMYVSRYTECKIKFFNASNDRYLNPGLILEYGSTFLIKQNNGGCVMYDEIETCMGGNELPGNFIFFRTESEAYETFIKLFCEPDLLQKAIDYYERRRYAKKD